MILALAGFGVAGWFLYDGYIGWPHANEVWAAYESLKPEGEGDAEHAAEGHGDEPAEHSESFPQQEWEDLIEERGWQASVIYADGEARQPHGKQHGEGEIQFQFYMSIVCLLAGIGFLTKVLLARGMWIESDGASVTSSWGKGFRYDDVVEVNKKKWQNKGLAYIKHAAEGGSQQTFVIDDLKFDRAATDAILYEIEQAVGVDKIVGGRPEAGPGTPRLRKSNRLPNRSPRASRADSLSVSRGVARGYARRRGRVPGGWKASCRIRTSRKPQPRTRSAYSSSLSGAATPQSGSLSVSSKPRKWASVWVTTDSTASSV